MRTSSRVTRIAFVGVSGSGKSICGKLLNKIMKNDFPNFKVAGLNVALPLHRIQAYAYRSFGLENSGQDGQILQFLASHFENRLGPTFLSNFERVLGKYRKKKLLIINTDCRNNAYRCLKKCGFTFIRVVMSASIRANRLGMRGDLFAADPQHAVEQIDRIKPDYIIENNGDLADLESKLSRLIRGIFRLR